MNRKKIEDMDWLLDVNGAWVALDDFNKGDDKDILKFEKLNYGDKDSDFEFYLATYEDKEHIIYRCWNEVNI